MKKIAVLFLIVFLISCRKENHKGNPKFKVKENLIAKNTEKAPKIIGDYMSDNRDFA
ncbi:hypothetical protein [Flavobacterium marginilacus]|nr:hypothetical protein [Flavobacterium marginilacus]